MAQFHRTLLLLLFVTKALSESGSTNASRKYELYHDLGDGFTPRNSVITLTASKDESSSYSILVKESSSTNNVVDVNAVCEDGTCETQSPEEIAILELMKSGKFYKIKAVDVETGKETMTSVHPCSIRKSNFRETLNLILSPKGNLISLDYVPIISPMLSSVACHTFESTMSSKPLQFTTKSITYSTSTPAMEINLKPNEGSLPKNAVKVLPRDRRRTSTGATNPGQDDAFPGLEDQQNTSKSFLARYWYIFLPMLIMSLFGEAPEEENASRQGQGQGQAQGQSQGQGRAAINASSGASSAGGRPTGGVKQRRGKRG